MSHEIIEQTELVRNFGPTTEQLEAQQVLKDGLTLDVMEADLSEPGDAEALAELRAEVRGRADATTARLLGSTATKETHIDVKDDEFADINGVVVPVRTIQSERASGQDFANRSTAGRYS